MKDRLSTAFKIARCVIASLKTLPGRVDVSYNEMYSIYSDIAERITGYRDPSTPDSDLSKEQLDKVESDVRRVIGSTVDDESDEGRHKIQMFIMEAVSQAETLSRMRDDVGTGEFDE